MKKLAIALFMILSIGVFATEDVTTIDKQVQGVNKEQLETNKVSDTNVDIKSGTFNNQNEVMENTSQQNKIEKVKVVEGDKKAIEKDLAQDAEGSSIWKYVIGGLGVVALIIAL